MYLSFMDAETATTLLGTEHTPTMNLRNVLKAGAVAKCRDAISTKESGNMPHVMSSMILKDLEALLGRLYVTGPLLC